jgi:pimeloyl-ACP methyl ester carboxylesterase
LGSCWSCRRRVACEPVAAPPTASPPTTAVGRYSPVAAVGRYSPALAALDGRGTLVAPDSRGRGASASIIGPFGIDAHADLLAVLDRTGATTATIVGHSTGGFVAVSCAARYPEWADGSSSSRPASILASRSGGIQDR